MFTCNTQKLQKENNLNSSLALAAKHAPNEHDNDKNYYWKRVHRNEQELEKIEVVYNETLKRKIDLVNADESFEKES